MSDNPIFQTLTKIPPHMLQDIPGDKIPELKEARGNYESLLAHINYLKKTVESIVIENSGINKFGDMMEGELILAGGATVLEGETLNVFGTARFMGATNFENEISSVSSVDTDGQFGVSTVVGNAYNKLIQTSNTIISTFTPKSNGNFLIYIYMRVEKDDTNVTLKINFQDAGGQQEFLVLNNTNQSIGVYIIPSIFISAIENTSISISATASGENKVYISASIVGL